MGFSIPTSQVSTRGNVKHPLEMIVLVKHVYHGLSSIRGNKSEGLSLLHRENSNGNGISLGKSSYFHLRSPLSTVPALNVTGAGEQGGQRTLLNSFPGMLFASNRSPETLSLAIIVSQAQTVLFKEQGRSKDARAQAKVGVNRNADISREGISDSLHEHAGSKYEGDAWDTSSEHSSKKRAMPVHDRSIGSNNSKCVGIPRKSNRQVDHKSNMKRKPNAGLEDADHTLETCNILRGKSNQDAPSKENDAKV